MAEQMIEYSSYNIPTELIINILLRSHMKVIIRCTSVCKSWYSLIKNPSFVTSHFSLSSNTNSNGYILIGGTNLCHAISDTSFKLQYSIEIPFSVIPHHKFSLNFVGSCNGLVCLAPGIEFHLGKDVFIWNPMIKKCKKLPPSRFSDMFTNDEKMMVFVLGFGFHETMNDYKVVRFIYLSYNLVYVAPLVEVYSLRSDSWKIVDTEIPLSVCRKVLTFHKGVFYWSGHFTSNYHIGMYIMSFDLDDEMFSVIEQPLLDFPGGLIAMRGSSDSLFAICSKNCRYNSFLELWKMDENRRGWTKAYRIQCDGGADWTIGFTRSNKFVYSVYKNMLASFDLESLKTEFHDIVIPFSRFAVDANYMESFLLFDH